MTSSGLPGPDEKRTTSRRERHRSCLTLLLTGFAEPAGHPTAGELLPRHFTLTLSGGVFLLHFPSTSPKRRRLPVRKRDVLRSSDFPHTSPRVDVRDCPASPPCIDQIFPSSTSSSTSSAMVSARRMRPQFSQVYILSRLYFCSITFCDGIAE